MRTKASEMCFRHSAVIDENSSMNEIGAAAIFHPMAAETSDHF
jgi:hypothetical protein